MSYLVTSEKYHSDELAIEESTIEIHGDNLELNKHLESFEADTLVVIQKLVGDCEYQTSIPLEQSVTDPGGLIFSGRTSGPMSLSISFFSQGFSKVRLIVAQIRKGFVNTFRGFPCKLCKLAIKTIISTILVQLGVPIALNGEFDLKSFVSSITTAATDIANGAYGQVVEALSGLLPSNWWDAVLNLLHLANWLLDASDAIFEKICAAIGMCPPKPQPAAP